MKPLVISHAHCTDGFGAAFAAWMKFGDEAEYLFMNYGEELFAPTGVNDWINREVYILDFSFPRETMNNLFQNAKKVAWLDHHKTAFEMWCGEYKKGDLLDSGEFGDGSGSRIILNDNKSGALLAWEYFHPDKEVPMMIKYIDDRDRWQFKIEGSKEFHAALASYKPWSFEQWEAIYHRPDAWDLKGQGSAILRAQEQQVKSMAKGAVKCRVSFDVRMNPGISADGFDDCEWYDFGLAINTNCHMSEVGHELANASGTFGLVYYIGSNGKVKLSFRSNGDYDVSAIAKALGGGGHMNAAGAETDINTLMGWLK